MIKRSQFQLKVKLLSSGYYQDVQEPTNHPSQLSLKSLWGKQIKYLELRQGALLVLGST